VAQGTPEDVLGQAHSHTAMFLKDVLAAGPHAHRPCMIRMRLRRKRRTTSPWKGRQGRGHAVGKPTAAAGHTEPARFTQGSAMPLGGASARRRRGTNHELRQVFNETNWRHPTTVEIAGPVKNQGWFFHAHTAWNGSCALVFRVARNTFKQEELDRDLAIPTLDDTEGVEIYGHEPRVHVANRKGPWQEFGCWSTAPVKSTPRRFATS